MQFGIYVVNIYQVDLEHALLRLKDAEEAATPRELDQCCLAPQLGLTLNNELVLVFVASHMLKEKFSVLRSTCQFLVVVSVFGSITLMYYNIMLVRTRKRVSD